jgi:hypothetical protein
MRRDCAARWNKAARRLVPVMVRESEQVMTRQAGGKASADERLSGELEDTFPASDTPSILRRAPRREQQEVDAEAGQLLVVENLGEGKAAQAAVAPGWWVLDSAGVPVLGPFPSHGAAAAALKQRRD